VSTPKDTPQTAEAAALAEQAAASVGLGDAAAAQAAAAAEMAGAERGPVLPAESEMDAFMARMQAQFDEMAKTIDTLVTNAGRSLEIWHARDGIIQFPSLKAFLKGVAEFHATGAKLNALGQAIEEAAQQRNLIEYLDCDRKFHAQLISAIANPRLTDLVDRLRRQARLFGLQELADTGKLVASAQEHRTLLRVLQSGDVAASESLMTAHIAHTRGLWAGRSDEAG